MTLAVTAKGVQLFVKINDEWSSFEEVSAVPELGASPEKIDVTHLTSDMKEYVKDIPDFSSELEFTMNAMPKGSESSNLDLIESLDEDETYEWKIVYPQLLTQATLKGQFSWRMGSAAVSSKQDVMLVIVPRSKPVWSEYTATQSLSYITDEEASA